MDLTRLSSRTGIGRCSSSNVRGGEGGVNTYGTVRLSVPVHFLIVVQERPLMTIM